MTLTTQLRGNMRRCTGLAAAIRYTTTFNPEASLLQMIAAGAQLGLNAATVKTQFYKARREDAEVEESTKGMTDEQFIEAIIRTNR